MGMMMRLSARLWRVALLTALMKMNEGRATRMTNRERASREWASSSFFLTLRIPTQIRMRKMPIWVRATKNCSTRKYLLAKKESRVNLFGFTQLPATQQQSN